MLILPYCPYCGAMPGEPCRRPNDEWYRDYIHVARGAIETEVGVEKC